MKKRLEIAVLAFVQNVKQVEHSTGGVGLRSELGWSVAEQFVAISAGGGGGAELAAAVEALGDLYESSSEAVQRHIVNTVLEHICESEADGPFQEWKSDPLLSGALQDAQAWGNWIRSLRDLLLQVADACFTAPTVDSPRPAIRGAGFGSAMVVLDWQDGEGPDGVTTVVLAPSEALAAEVASGLEVAQESLEHLVQSVADRSHWTRDGDSVRVEVGPI